MFVRVCLMSVNACVCVSDVCVYMYVNACVCVSDVCVYMYVRVCLMSVCM